jgi:hypothetical protein
MKEFSGAAYNRSSRNVHSTIDPLGDHSDPACVNRKRWILRDPFEEEPRAGQRALAASVRLSPSLHVRL